ncbi:hypothetical protein BO70DRAFT_357767 [Aspergillus heteromorphus CBS 117.55]|uniref:Programmed cell death protein 2 C-terminal domain-containing protein n=1 Tax=Aspergillus heteromorphus CBS 117.55 TaxID=1448321 RepID=A0A317X1Z7_9EURO|nr:uncharacterized protein BO70DRAFT_357767 [Aspergillus heteromorphus CBS 117.55]PWY92629.1 hypothetical protein BO70DRAFT_357767 [Aspergillus heteromorphus CBS 117.55]
MDPYDSDSSGSEDEGDTGVLLGYAADEMIEDTISHLGGWPTWLDDATPPPGDFAKCKVCNQPMLLLIELHGDLPDDFPHDERRLYILSCPRKACNRKPGSIRALRATRKLKVEKPRPKKEEKQPQEVAEEKKEEEEKNDPPAPKQDLGASLFGSSTLTGSVSASANPFSSSPAAQSNNANPFANPFAAPAPSPGLAAKPTPTATPTATPTTTTTTTTTTTANTLSESFADKVRVSSPPPSTANLNLLPPPEAASGPSAPWPAQSDFPAPYTQFFLDAEYEQLSRPSTPTIPDNVTIDNTEEEGPGGSSRGGELKDTFESDLDKAFIRFSTRLGQNPEQVLRYQFRGSPLLYSFTDPVGKRLHDKSPAAAARGVSTVAVGNPSRIPRCEYCGSERVFEFQLVPHAISVLEEGREDVGLAKDDAGMEWGTIILGVCAKDCGPKEVGVVGYREEWAGVQWEEAAK